MAFDCDLFVIGAGSGGVRAARVAAGHGAKVVVAEEFRVGGTCVIRGCVPKKLLVYASRFADEFAAAAGFGWTVEPPRFDWPTLVEAKDREIARLSAAYRAGLDSAGATLIEERADRRRPPHVAIVRRAHDQRAPHPRRDGRAAGAAGRLSRARARHHVQRDLRPPAFPQRLLVVGGGYIAVEFACLFAKLGAEVTQVMRADNVLRGFDEDMREGLRDELKRAGVRLRFGCAADALRAARRSAAGDALRRRLAGGRPGAGRDRAAAEHRGARPRGGRRRARRHRRGRGRRPLDLERRRRSTRSATSPIASI